MNTAKVAGLALAAAAAGFFATATPVIAAEEGKIKCENATSCKGHSECATATTGCKGHNACKGKGWVYTKTKEECAKLQAEAKK